jgi:hypothetical protein
MMVLASIWLMLTACSDQENAKIEVRLTDAPGDFEALHIDIQEVQVNGSADDSGWQSLEIEKGVYDILTLTNGLDTLLGTIELPAGKIQQIRLVLGDNNTVQLDGKTYPISTPSAQQSGLKLNLNATLLEGVTYKILLDFDAARSVVQKGNKSFLLKPVIRALEEATSGAIKGVVSPPEATPAIYAIAGTDTVGTAFTDAAGKFLIRGVEAGTYTISIVPKSGFSSITKTEVQVQNGTVTDVGTIAVE